MIIYQVIPNRAYPYIISSLLGKNLTTNELSLNSTINYFKYAFEFSEIFDVDGLSDLEKMYAYQTAVIRFHPSKQLPRKFSEVYHDKYLPFIQYEYRSEEDISLNYSEKNKDIELLHGLFTSERIKNFTKSDDFTFTFLDHPVKGIYNLYKYVDYVYTLGIKEFKDNYYNSENLIPELYFEGRNYIHYRELFEKKPTLEKFIDSFIEDDCKWIHNFFYFPVKIYEEATGRLTKLYNHNFYGIVDTNSNLIKSINKFNQFKIFKERNFSIDINHFANYFSSYKDQKYTYRYNDLEYLFKDDINFFREKEKELNAS